jgi:hypothetical protein
MRLPIWLRSRLPCKACRHIRKKEPLQIKWPIQVSLDSQGAKFFCHQCGRTGRIDRSTIVGM